MGFFWEVPTRIHFGTGIFEQALIAEKGLYAGKSILLVTTGRTLTENGTVDRVRSILEREGCRQVIIYRGRGAEPRVREAEEAGRLARECKAEMTVGLGGGSAIDLAKASAVAAVSDIPLCDFLLEGLNPPDNTLPVLSMPTTAGSGSELSKGAILSDDRLKIKGGIRGKRIAPAAAIVDASFTWSMPWKLTVETGFDVLSHAIESYLSLRANKYSEMLSLQAIGLVGEHLRRLQENLDDHQARESMSYASMLMGMNLYNIGNCLPHRMQYPVGIRTGTSHGAGLMALYPAWLEEEFSHCKEKVGQVMEMLIGRTPEHGSAAKEMMIEFLNEFGVYHTMRDLGVRENEVNILAKEVRGSLASDPVSKEEGIVDKIYRKAFFGQ